VITIARSQAAFPGMRMEVRTNKYNEIFQCQRRPRSCHSRVRTNAKALDSRRAEASNAWRVLSRVDPIEKRYYSQGDSKSWRIEMTTDDRLRVMSGEVECKRSHEAEGLEGT
jgi:hypothetical protein